MDLVIVLSKLYLLTYFFQLINKFQGYYAVAYSGNPFSGSTEVLNDNNNNNNNYYEVLNNNNNYDSDNKIFLKTSN